MALIATPDRPTPTPAPAATPTVGAPEWVGEVDVRHPVADIIAAASFATARMLVTVDGVPVGQVTVPLVDGRAEATVVRGAIRRELGRHLGDTVAPLPAVDRAVTVVIATRNRPESLERCLRSLLRSTHRDLTVLVVDNDPDDDRTAAVVRALGDPRVEYVREARRGTSAGRNRGLAEAMARAGGFVAFTDDDVEVEPTWVANIAAALSEPGVACVCGPVLAARLDTPAQIAADTALGWQKGFARRRFSLAEPPADSAVFPFSPGLFGVGANMAADAAVAAELGGFDLALGPGTATRAGEDCEFMIRLVLAGHTLSYEPSAYVWHHHRPSDEELSDQLDGYALGLGGFLTKIMLDPLGRAAALRRIPAALRRLRTIRQRETAADPTGSGPSPWRTLRALAAAPAAYLQGRRAVRRAGGEVPPLIAPHPPRVGV
jgi:GT2 family glycosyltransferase